MNWAINLGTSILLKPIYYKTFWNHLTISGHHLGLNYNEIPLEVYIKCRISTATQGESGKIDVIAMNTEHLASTFPVPRLRHCGPLAPVTTISGDPSGRQELGSKPVVIRLPSSLELEASQILIDQDALYSNIKITLSTITTKSNSFSKRL